MGLFTRKFTIVVACKANITRSAYLHGYMKYYLKEHLSHARKKVRILSAGVQARSGSSADQVVKHVARTHGFSLSDHSSDPFTKKLVKKADVILVMERWQKDALAKRFPESEGKTFRITEYLWNGDPHEIRDIYDPTGQDASEYEEFVETAHAEVDRIFRELGRIGIV
jgi:protein-tyrosine phosphatase